MRRIPRPAVTAVRTLCPLRQTRERKPCSPRTLTMEARTTVKSRATAFRVRRWTVTMCVEDPSDNTDECTIEVEVVDETDPTASCESSTYTLSSAADTGTETVFTEDIEDGSEDNCEIESYSISRTLVDCDDVGSPPTITLTVEDPSDNTDECTIEVEVVDETDPTASCESSTYTLSSAADTGTETVFT
eukprot:143937_1